MGPKKWLDKAGVLYDIVSIKDTPRLLNEGYIVIQPGNDSFFYNYQYANSIGYEGNDAYMILKSPLERIKSIALQRKRENIISRIEGG